MWWQLKRPVEINRRKSELLVDTIQWVFVYNVPSGYTICVRQKNIARYMRGAKVMFVLKKEDPVR